MKLPSKYRNSYVKSEYVSHGYARGPNEYLADKIAKNVSYGVRCPQGVIDLVVNDFIDSATRRGWKFGMKRSIAQVLDLKKSAASVGEPFDTRFCTYQDLIENCPKELLSLVLEEHITSIEAGEQGFIPLNRCHIKYDKYSSKKMSEKRWRAIQASDVLTFMTFNHFLGELVELGELDHERIVVCMNALKWHDHIATEMNSKKTVGLDYSDFDETQSAHLLYQVTYLLALRSGCSENMARYLAHVAAYTWTVSPSGELFAKGGGGASGQFLTSILNSMINEIILTYCWSLVLQVPFSEVWGLRKWKIVGDDNVMQAESASEVLALTDEVLDCFGQIARVDFCDGEPYPVGAHAPFLSRVTAHVDGFTFTLPSEPTRLLSSWQVPDPEEEDEAAVYEGLAQELFGYRIIRSCGLAWPIPQVVLDFLDDYERKTEELGWVTVPLHRVVDSRVGLSFC